MMKGLRLLLIFLILTFLNKQQIGDRILDTVLSLSEAKSLKEVETIIRTVNSKLHDLGSLNLDLSEVNSAELVLVNKIARNKLPRHFLILLSYLGKLVLITLSSIKSSKCIKLSSLG